MPPGNMSFAIDLDAITTDIGPASDAFPMVDVGTGRVPAGTGHSLLTPTELGVQFPQEELNASVIPIAVQLDMTSEQLDRGLIDHNVVCL